MSHVWMSHVTRVNESRHSYELVMAHIWRSHVTHMNELCVTHMNGSHPHIRMSLVTHTHIWMGHVTHTHIWMSHVTHTHIWMRHVTHTHIRMSHVTHTHIWINHVARFVTHETALNSDYWVMPHIRMGHVTHTHTRFESYRTFRDSWNGPAFLLLSHTAHSNGSGHMYTHAWDMSHVWMSHVTHENESCHTWEWVMSHMRMSHVTHVNESCHTCEWVMSHMRHAARFAAIEMILHSFYRVNSHVWTSHPFLLLSQGKRMNESCRTYKQVISHVWMSHVTNEWMNQVKCVECIP